MHVLIIGGGIGGHALAIALKRRGIGFTLFERAEAPLEVGAGLTLWPNALRFLDEWGLASEVIAQGSEITRAELRDARGRLLASTSNASLRARAGQPVVGIHRATLLTELNQAVDAEHTRWAMTCEHVEQTAEGVTARFADGSEARGDLLIGADGLRSVVRTALLGDQPPRYADETSWRGVASSQAIPPPLTIPDGLAIECWGRGTRFGCLRIHRDQIYWYATHMEPAGGAKSSLGARSRLLKLFRDYASPVPDLIAATPDDTIVRTDIHDRPPKRPWVVGRIGLLGDAAHPTTPNLGQGACMAIEDAGVLAECLSTIAVAEEALRSYESRRFRRVERIVRESRKIGEFSQARHAWTCFARDWAVRMTPSWVLERTITRAVLAPL